MQRNRTVSQLAPVNKVRNLISDRIFNLGSLWFPISELSWLRAISALKSLSTLSINLAVFACILALEVSMGTVTHHQLDAHVLEGPDQSAVRI